MLSSSGDEKEEKDENNPEDVVEVKLIEPEVRIMSASPKKKKKRKLKKKKKKKVYTASMIPD